VVHHADGSTPVTVDQRYNGGRWNSLGEFNMAPGQNHRVALSAVAGERTTADSVRFVPIADKRTVQADSVKIVSNTAEDALYVHTDQLGTPRKLTGPTGTVVWDASLTPYGMEDSIAGTETLDSRFPGQWADAESGLNYNYFRDYDPTLGRYIQSDPIGLGGGLNTYAYVGGNPVMWIDPWGLDATIWRNRSGGRSIWNGPTNGNWGGKCWSGGQYSCGDNNPGSAPPTDSADACYKRHDNCYIQCNGDTECMAACDGALVNQLDALQDDPRAWPDPPRPGTELDSADYRDLARGRFRQQRR